MAWLILCWKTRGHFSGDLFIPCALCLCYYVPRPIRSPFPPLHICPSCYTNYLPYLYWLSLMWCLLSACLWVLCCFSVFTAQNCALFCPNVFQCLLFCNKPLSDGLMFSCLTPLAHEKSFMS